MKKIILSLVILAGVIWSFDALVGAKQETCPKDAPWTKVDGLSGFTYTFDVPEGYEVTDNCYKASTDVVYGSGDTVEAQDKYELSHASFKLVEVEQPEQPEEPEEPPVDEPEQPEEPKDPETPETPEEPEAPAEEPYVPDNTPIVGK